MEQQSKAMTLDPKKESDMAIIKKELISPKPKLRSTLQIQNARIAFKTALTEQQADTVIAFLKDTKDYDFDMLDVLVHMANLIITNKINAQIKTEIKIRRPIITFTFVKAAHILNVAIKRDEIIPWNEPHGYRPAWTAGNNHNKKEELSHEKEIW